MKKNDINKEIFFGVPVSNISYDELKNNIIKDIENNKKSFIVAINPEKLIKTEKDLKLKKVLKKATYQIPDGIGVVFASKLTGGLIKSRVTGIDCMNMLCQTANDNKYKVFLYGAKPEVVKQTKLELEKKFPKIKIVGAIDGYEEDNFKIIKAINKSKAQILFVALGSPKQEYFISENMKNINVNIFQGVGGSFDVISGNVKRAPKIFQRLGLEWFYRLIKEPKRIVRQFGKIKFLIKVIKERRQHDEN